MILNLYKERGETPLERIQRFVAENPEFDKDPSTGQKVKMTYLGRLDPMAEGVLLVASGDDIKRKEEFLELDKDYEFTAVFGFATDTYDILGKVLRVSKIKNFFESDVRKAASVYIGEREQKYPLYSSKVISKGLKKGLVLWQEKSSRSESSRVAPASLPGISDDEIPTKKINIYDMKFKGLVELKPKEFFGRLLMDISKVRGDFRQNSTLVLWQKILQGYRDGKVYIGQFSASVSSGTYIRGIVNDLGNTLGVGACALSIKRTRVGEYSVANSRK